MIPKAAILLVLAVALALVPASQADASSDFKVSYDSIPQEEMEELLGDGFLDMIHRYVLETVGINLSGDGCPETKATAANIRFSLEITSGDGTGSVSQKKQMETFYTYYLEYDLSMALEADGSGYDAFDEDVTDGTFPFMEYSSDDTGTIAGRIILKIDVDLRETATAQEYDPRIYAINSSTMIRTTYGFVDLLASFVHDGVVSNADIYGIWDTRSVTVSDFIYPDEDKGVKPGDEVYCRWSSREDSADVNIDFTADSGTYRYIRDIGECTSGTSHGAVPDSFFQNDSKKTTVDSYMDAVSKPFEKFSRGELAGEYMRDDGLDPYREPERIEEGMWQPAMSLIAAAIFIFIAVAKMHEGMFRY
ncbi:MAG: hypothetical protein J5812_00330 [Candidatus Methanomethylophilaceae archaeon]|nr:hypothetical protein [Candidatus Methanomethylophilaceae archaeon]